MQTDNKEYPLPDFTNSLCDRLGIRLTLLEEGFVKATMPVDERTCQLYGKLHGGASLALAESVAGHGSIPLARVHSLRHSGERQPSADGTERDNG